MSYRIRLVLNHHKRSVLAFLILLLLLAYGFRFAMDLYPLGDSFVYSSEPQTDSILQETDHIVDFADLSWEDKRSRLQFAGGPTKVFLFSYMRGGSTIAGEIFNQDSAASMMYEPGSAFFAAAFGVDEENFPQHDLYFSNLTRRPASDLERQWLTEYYTNILTCQYESLPPEAMGHWFVTKTAFLSNYTQCMGSDIQADYTINRCVRMISPLCGTTVESSHREKCHILIEATRMVFIENPELFRDMLQSLRDLMEFNNFSLQMTNLLEKKVAPLGYFSPNILTRLKWFVQHRLCMETVRINNDRCLSLASNSCKESDIRVAQVNRMNMENLEGLIESNPDIYILYFIRDPRAIALSRSNTDHLLWDITDKRPANEAKIICHKMAEDIAHMKRLEERYPGVFIEMKYEKLIQNPAVVAEEIYGYFGKTPSPQWAYFAQRTMNAAEDGGPYDNYLKNAMNNSVKWVTDIPREQLDEINKLCGPVLEQLEYPII